MRELIVSKGLSNEELIKLLGFFRLEPTGGRAENMRFGMLATVIARLKGNKKLTVDMLFPDGPDGEAKKKAVSATGKKRMDWRVMLSRLKGGMKELGLPIGKA